jgi:hypothetical protein
LGWGKLPIEPAKWKFLAIPSKKGEIIDLAELKNFISNSIKKSDPLYCIIPKINFLPRSHCTAKSGKVEL